METIKLLPDDVINKIAAGEVVERPVSVIKELVENSIDAGSNSIQVELEEGGISRITVSDNGSGMSPADAKTALMRHATSKINSADDLFSISTMGFRGEALASIASVSEFSLMTRRAQDAVGSKITYENNKVEQQTWKGETGTTINIENLFCNIPVRQRFLKASATEFSHCLEYMQAAALSNPFVAFELIHNSKSVFKVDACEADPNFELPLFGEKVLGKRAKDTLGNKHASELFYVQKTDKFGTLEALCSPPGVEKSNGKYIFSFVNGSWVKDKTIRFGIMRGYHSHLLKGKFPVAVLNFHIEPSLVDVNVHPSKTELRFQYTSEVSALIAVAIREGLRKGEWALEGHSYHSSTLDRSSGEPESPFRSSPTLTTSRSSDPFSLSPTASRSQHISSLDVPISSAREKVESFSSHQQPSQLTPVDKTVAEHETIPWDELQYVGSFARCYLIFETPQNHMLVVDQHAFHERVLYERLTKNRKLIEKTQPLLVAESVELSPSDLSILKEKNDGLRELGFGFEFVSDTTVDVVSLPAILSRANLQRLVESFTSELSSSSSFEDTSSISQLLLATIACHAAVRAGEQLPDNELKFLMSEASDVDFYHNCPHGRRVFRTYTKAQVERWFDR